MSQTDPSAKELEAYCAEYIESKDQTKAWKFTFPTSTAKPETIHCMASRFHKIPKVRARIEELRAITVEIAEKKFTITVEQRLQWLKEIVDAGLGEYIDPTGNKRREGLSASKGAIDTLNAMLGTKEESEDIIKPIPIGVIDAS